MTFDDKNEELISKFTWVPIAEIGKAFYELKKEYAPTIEMTKSEKDNIKYKKKYGLSFINFYADVIHQSTAIKFGSQTTPELYKYRLFLSLLLISFF